MNMAQETNPGQAPMLCTTGCGFYGNPRTNGMCSVCYKDHLQRQNGSSGRISPPTSPVINVPESSPVKTSDDNVQGSQSTDIPSSAPVQPTPTSSRSPASEAEASSQVEHETDDKIAAEAEDLQASASESAQNSSEELEKSPDKPKMKKKNRCFMCRKKVGLTGFECRCGNVFCGTHRYSDVHSCSYDYKADAAEKIRKENPVVVGEKVQKI